MLWKFYGSDHRKGEWDGAGAVVKRTLRSKQLLNPSTSLKNAQDCVTFLKKSLGGQVPNVRQQVR